MATLAQEIPDADVLKALPILKDLIVNHSVGGRPEELMKEVEQTYDVPLREFMKAAVGEDREESRELQIRAIEQAAHAMGRHDGARLLASRQGLSRSMDVDDYDAIVAASEKAPAPKGAYQRVYAAYRQGMREAAAIVYVNRNVPMERRRQVAEARAVRSTADPVKAEDLIETSMRELEAAGQDPEARIIAASALAVARQTADRVAEDALKFQVDTIVRGSPDLTATEALQRARLVHRSASAGGTTRGAGWSRAAWSPVSMNDVEGVAAGARAEVYDPEIHTQSERRGTART